MKQNSNKIAEAELAVQEASNLEILCHEVRNPLNGVMGYVALLGKTNLNEEQMDFVSGIQRSSEQMLRVIDNVLNFSNPTAPDFTPNVFTISELLVNLNSSVKSLLAGKKVLFNIATIYNCDVLLEGSMTSLYQIILNLLCNSIKFTEAGFIELSITKLSETNEKVNLEFCVSDTGHGVNENNLSKLFSPFFQEENNLKYNNDGFGLGLHIVKKLLNNINGDIIVKSHLGVGTKFMINVPFIKVKEEFIYSLKVPDKKPSIKVPDKKYKVLVVDDSELNRMLFQKILAQTDLIVLGSKDYFTAKKYLDLFSFDLILTDYFMPGGNGFQLVNYIRNDLSLSTKIILITAIDDIKSEVAFEVDLILNKPISPEKLVVEVIQILNI